MSPFLTTTPFLAVKVPAAVIHLDVAAAGHTAFAHAAGHDRRMGRHAAAGRQDALGCMHAVDILGRCLDAHQDDLAPDFCLGLGLIRGKNDLAGQRHPVRREDPLQ